MVRFVVIPAVEDPALCLVRCLDPSTALLPAVFVVVPDADRRALQARQVRPRAPPRVPDRREDGTNGLLVRPPGLIHFCFGAGSFERHASAAEGVGATVQVFRSVRLMLDLDTPDDLLVYLDLCGKYDLAPLIELAAEDLLPMAQESCEHPLKEKT